MTEYRVTWSIDVEADTPEDAAEWALALQRDPETIATVFEVCNRGTGQTIEVDLTEQS